MTKTRTPGLDVLRAAAVLTVAGYHVLSVCLAPLFPHIGDDFFAAGGVAVEAFYALSGYLIGRILLNLLEAPTPTAWLQFMSRRWTRTLPLYFAVVSVAVCLARPEIGDALSFMSMTQNLTGGIGRSMLGSLLQTTWSLTVEEVFYLTFATSLLVACYLCGRRATWPVILAFLVVPPVLRALYGSETQTYFAALLNLDGISWGVALAQLERDRSRIFRTPGASFMFGILLVAAAWWPYASGMLDARTQWLPGSLTLAGAGCALVVAAAVRMGDMGKMGGLVRAVSARSYSIYLVHWLVVSVVYSLMENHVMGIPVALVACTVVTAGISWATHRFIELPGMRLRLPRMMRRLTGVAVPA